MSMFPNAWMSQPHTIAMDLPKILARDLPPRRLDDRDDGTGGLGLGWLITIAVLGGILLFASIGYLLAWKIRQRCAPVTRRVYATDPASDHYDPTALTTVLSRRRLLNSQTTMQVLPSDASELTLGNGRGDQLPWHPPPVLPPLPKSRSFGLNVNGLKSRWIVDGESDHGPERRRWSWRDSWVGVMMGSGALATATLPDVEAHAPEQTPAQAPTELKDMSPVRNEIHVQKKRQSQPPAATLGGSATAPELGNDEEERGRSRLAGQTRYIKPDGTETDLKDILACTEQRLRDGTSRSPVKTPRGSPHKGSPMKTPRTGSSTKTRGRVTPSPSKKSIVNTPGTNKSRGASVSSIGSAANSLIRAATEELQLPGGMASPSRLRAGQEWSQQPQAQQLQSTSPQRSPPRPSPRRRSASLDSDVSSALSTLYSVGEPEDEISNDPFIENKPAAPPTQDTRQQITGPRPLRRTKTLNEGKASGEVVDESAVPAPLRTISVNSHRGGRMGRRGSLRMAPVLSPPSKRGSVETKPKNDLFVGGQRSVSEGSESVYTDVTVPESEEEQEDGEVTPKGVKRQESTSNIATPTRVRQGTADLTSSPLNEREVLSLLHQSAQPRRGLPKPPTKIMLNDETLIPTPLSPRPKSQHQRPPTRRASIASTSSSNYDQDFNGEESDVPTSLPGRRATTSGLHSVGSTCAELRRMNSVVSSYSVASVASTVFGDDTNENETPTLPALRGGGFSPDRTQSKNVKDGKKNYLNVGGQGSVKGKGKGKGRSGHSRSNSRSSIPVKKDTKGVAQQSEDEKENQGLGLRVRFELPSPRRSPNGPRTAMRSPTRMPLKDEEKEKERRRKQRESGESLGLYDQDGFLKSSPDRDAVAKGGRLRM